MVDVLIFKELLIQKITIQNLKGLHARATAAFVKTASAFQSDIKIQKSGGIPVSGKSIMGILMLGIGLGEEITLTVHGVDAPQAMKALIDLINARFNEE